jgi:hypothetical protein
LTRWRKAGGKLNSRPQSKPTFFMVAPQRSFAEVRVK